MKCNDYFEFPLDLDMKEYCEVEENFPPSYFKYKLGGVVLHEGSWENGHVTSIIKDWFSDNEWFLFNDDLVSKFDLKNLREEAFGGNGRSWNAYLLVYEKVKYFNND